MKIPSQFILLASLYRKILSGITCLLILFSSCRTQKQVQYLQGPFDTTALNQLNIPEPVIQKGDLLGIVVYSDNPELTAFYNQMGSAGSTGASSSVSQSQSSGYLVDNEGNIQFQSLGNLSVEGLTKTQLQNILIEKLQKFLRNPYCTVRILNKKFTILGEVLKQGLYPFPAERVNILEALGLAGDVTLYALKDSIMVIRETNGKRTFANLNVSNPQIFVSPYYYHQQNDIIIVKSTHKKPSVSDQTTSRNLAVFATIATILTSFAVIFNIFK